ncbi:MAG: hypothetical protein DMF86_20345 [Acidobacteria bacterium]|nr:MAG: hypothetical protein DMF86_20345 [Acidobacteriota bacterium]
MSDPGRSVTVDVRPPTPPSRPLTHRARRAAALQLALAALAVTIAPIGLRALNYVRRTPRLQPTYLPALEGPRERLPFDAAPVGDLAGMNPTYVVIGDSMAGSRIDPRVLTELTHRPIAPLLQPASGPAWWYLALKNWVIPSGIHPRCVFIFFRDTNLTNALFRLDDQFRWAVDRVALDREDEVNAVVAARQSGGLYRVRDFVDRTALATETREWVEPGVSASAARIVEPYRKKRADFLVKLNERFGLDHLRPMDAADIQLAEDRDADFDAYVGRSFLPLMLRDAGRAALPLCFVRVQRRPAGGRPPVQSAALRGYVAKLRAYIESHGAMFRDDYGDPALTLDLYSDGDHLSPSGRRRYTEVFYVRLRPLFP